MPSLQKLKPQWFQILLALADCELHGLGIQKEILRNTEGQMKLWPATLYGSLKRMVADGFIGEREQPNGPATDGDRRRFYKITAKGSRTLRDEVARLAKYVRVAESKLTAGGTGT